MQEITDSSSLQDAVQSWCGSLPPQFYGEIAGWDTSRVESMIGLFGFEPEPALCPTYSAFNDNISKWDTSSVSTMYTSK